MLLYLISINNKLFMSTELNPFEQLENDDNLTLIPSESVTQIADLSAIFCAKCAINIHMSNKFLRYKDNPEI